MDGPEHEPQDAGPAGTREGVPPVGLGAARAAFGRGEFETCLEAARVALAAEADGGGRSAGDEHSAWTALREEALAAVRARCARAGGSADARWLGVLVRHDPRAADSIHLAWRTPRVVRAEDGPASGDGPADAAAGEATAVPDLVGIAPRFRLTVDEAGVFLCVVADELTLGAGGSGAGEAAGPLALRRVAALRGGFSWRLDPGPGGVLVDGEAPGAEGAVLRGGERIAVPAGPEGGPRLLRLTLGPEGATARLDLEGPRPDGAVGALLLLAAGREGRLWIGDRGRALVRTPALPDALELWLEGTGLRLRGRGPLTLRGARDRRSERSIEAGRAVELPWPPNAAIDVLAPPREPGRAPFWMRIEPTDGEEGVEERA